MINETRKYLRVVDMRLYPLYYIEGILAVASIAGGILVVVPGLTILRQPEKNLAVFEVIGSELGILALGLFAIISGLLVFYGMFKNSVCWRARGIFMMFLTRLYVTTGTLAVYGLFPTTWISQLVLTLITAVIWLVLKDEVGVDANGP